MPKYTELQENLLTGMREHGLSHEVGEKVEKVPCVFGCASSDGCNITITDHNVVSGKCFSCDVGTSATIDKSREKSHKPKKDEPVVYPDAVVPNKQEWSQDLLDYWQNERGITKETLDAVGAYQCYEYFPHLNGKSKATAYPYTDTTGKIVQVKLRAFPEKGFVQTTKKGKPAPFNVRAVFENWDNCKELNIGEGESDGKTLIQCGIPNVLSPITGSSGSSVFYKYPFLKNAEKVIVWADNDEAGKKLINGITKIFGVGKVFVASVGDFNDVNEMYLAGGEPSIVQAHESCRSVSKRAKEPFEEDDEEQSRGDIIVQCFNEFLAKHHNIYMVYDELAEDDTWYMEWQEEGFWRQKREKAVKDYILRICRDFSDDEYTPKYLRNEVFPLVLEHLRNTRKTIDYNDINVGLKSKPFKNMEKSACWVTGEIINTPKNHFMTAPLGCTSDEATMDWDIYNAGEYAQMQRDWHPTPDEAEVFFEQAPKVGNLQKIDSINDMIADAAKGNDSKYAMMIRGSGMDGKSVQLECWKHAFGRPGYKVVEESVFLRVSGKGRHRSERQGLGGVRIAAIPEVSDKSSTLIGGNIKELAGPNTISVSPMYKSSQEQDIAIMPLIVSNFPIDMKDVEVGMQRRIKLITFDQPQKRSPGQERSTDRQHVVTGSKLRELEKRVSGQVIWRVLQSIKKWNREFAQFGHVILCDEIENDSIAMFEAKDVLMEILRSIAIQDEGHSIFITDLGAKMKADFPTEYDNWNWGKRGQLMAQLKERLILKSCVYSKRSDSNKNALHGWRFLEEDEKGDGLDDNGQKPNPDHFK